jgi:hypothetical protein
LKLLHIRRSGSELAWENDQRENTSENGSSDPDSGNENTNEHNEPKDESNSGDDLNMPVYMTTYFSRPIVPRVNVPSRPHASESDLDNAERDLDLEAAYQLQDLPDDLLWFALWAFGPEGIPSLKVLAYGDFSYQGRHRSTNAILCRNEWKFPKPTGYIVTGKEENTEISFRPIRDSDTEMMELVYENMDFLEACPVDPILMRQGPRPGREEW